MTEPATAPLIPGRPRLSLALLAATVIVEGTLVMVLEIAGGRMIGPFFGVSLFVWTALIAVTLLSLACGYALGGTLADRWRRPEGLYGAITIAGVLVLAVPLAQVHVIVKAMELGLRTGALTASAALLMPPLVLLGMVSPYVIRLAASGVQSVGRTAGLFFALSTIGSLTGTVVTGFVLIEVLGTRGIFAAVGCALVAMGAAYFLLTRRRLAAAAALSALLLPAFYPGLPGVAVTADGTRARLVETVDSFYGNLRIVDYSHDGSPVRLREMLIDGLVQGGIDLATGRSVYAYPELAAALPDLLADDVRPREVLVVGLGTGAAVRLLAGQGHAVDVVEINPAVVRLARRHFGEFGERALFVADARQFLTGAGQRYDVVFLDVFSGDITPGTLLSREAIDLLRQRLKPGGLFIANLVGRLNGDTRATASIARTIAASFANVRLYPLFDPAAAGASGNLLLTAQDGPPRQAAVPALRQLAARMHPLARAEAAHLAAHQPPRHASALLLSDDFNPLEQMDQDIRDSLREEILRTTPAAILLGG